MGIHGQRLISAAFLWVGADLFFSCSRWLTLWISLWFSESADGFSLDSFQR